MAMTFDREDFNEHTADYQRGYADALSCYRTMSMSVLKAQFHEAERAIRETMALESGEGSHHYALGLQAGIRRCLLHRMVMDTLAQPQRGGRPLFACQPTDGR